MNILSVDIEFRLSAGMVAMRAEKIPFQGIRIALEPDPYQDIVIRTPIKEKPTGWAPRVKE